MFRRTLLMSAGAAALALAACSGSGSSTTVTQEILTYIQDIQTGLTALSPVLSTIPGITASVISTIKGYLAEAVEVALGVTSATSAAAGQSAVAQIETYTMDALTLLSAFTLPGGVGAIVAALKVALPFVEAAVSALGTSNVGATPDPEALRALATLGNAKAVLAGS